MSVYVDEIAVCIKNKSWPYSQACHLVSDTVDELNQFAQQLGLKQKWFQGKSLPHYDLTKGMRHKAIRQGAIEIDRDRFVQIFRKYREKTGLLK